jgi:uncharacterized protein YecT (DUF1311 family)
MLYILVTALVLVACSALPSQTEAPIRPEILQESERYTLADAELNRVYNELLDHYDADQRELLRKAERAWITTRDAQADLVVSRTGGWGRTASYYSSLTKMTKARIRDLKELLSDE